MGGSELIIVGTIVAAVVVLIVLLGRLLNGSKQSTGGSKTIALAEASDAWLGRVAMGLSGLPFHRVEWPSPTTLQVYWTRRPVWTFIVAVLFFPLGLIALLVTTTLIGTIRILESGPPGKIPSRW